MSLTSGRYPLLLAILFLGYWIVLAIAPRVCRQRNRTIVV